jgi:cytochrome c oxidase cbb3-type subunit 1
MRFLGGVLVVIGFVLMLYNMIKTIYAKDGSLEPIEAT